MKVAVTTLAFCVAALLALGLVMIYSSSLALVNARTHAAVGADLLQMQLVWCVFGLALCVTATALDYERLKKFVWPLFILALVLLALVLAPLPHHITATINGARRWFNFGRIRFQPSELGKLSLIILLAWYGDRYQRKMKTWNWGIVFPVVIITAMLALIFCEPDRGTTILLAAVGGSILLLAGVEWKFIVPPVVLAIVGLTISILHDAMRMRRIISWLNTDKHGVGNQAYQAMIALGSGGWFGLGLGNGRQKLGFVPEDHTDFIFSIIGEELGLVATLLVIVAFVVILLCGIYIALNARDTFGLLLAGGVTLLISLQAAINIGVVTSALPNKGLPLPFISYGGSNLVAMLTCVGILFSVARRAPAREKIPKAAKSTIEADENPFAARAT